MKRVDHHSVSARRSKNGLTFRDFLDRYGLALGVVGALILTLALLPSNAQQRVATGRDSSEGSAIEPGSASVESGQTIAAGGATSQGGGAAGTGAAGRIASSGGSVVLGKGSCRADGRQKGITRYMPPCLSFSGDNGGVTARGVTANQIKVVRYIGDRDPATQAILEGAKLADSLDIVRRSYDAFRIYSNQHYETYGREVVFEEVKASGPLEDDQAMKRDAVRIANEIKAFAVIVGDPAAQIPGTLATELAVRGVLCICTVSGTSQWYLDRPPYIFSSLPTFNEYATHIAEYIGKRLVGEGRTAKWAGDPTMIARPRRFGLIYIAGARGRVEPEAKNARDILVRELARFGVNIAAEKEYLYDPGRNQQDVTNMIATMRNAEVTTVIPIVDPLYPILITSEATRQGYFPEWFITGTGLSDTTAAGRLYDQAQWRHAFGISPLPITWVDVRRSPGYREFYHGKPDVRPGSCGTAPCEGVLLNIYRAYVQTLFRGIHMAGPRLTADTFAQGSYNFPPTGGLPGAPLVFLTRQLPTEIKDFTEVFYASDQRGRDERGEDGVGMIMKVDLGKRYRPGQWPSSDPRAFDMNNAMAVSDNPPGGGDPTHEEDGHTHSGRCLSC